MRAMSDYMRSGWLLVVCMVEDGGMEKLVHYFPAVLRDESERVIVRT